MPMESKTDYTEILNKIPQGKDNAISRQALRYATNTSDRQMRRLIHEAREAGNIICSTGKGYFIPETVEEIKHQYYREKKRIASTYAGIRIMRARLKELGEKV